MCDYDVAVQHAAEAICDGACETHIGHIRPVHVKQWGWFSYCETAVAEDKSRGLQLSEQDERLIET